MTHKGWKKLLGLDLYRSLYLKRAPKGPMAELYRLGFPWPETVVSDVEFVAIDFETTALEPSKGEIVSAGWVVIKNLTIDYRSAQYHLVKTEQPISEESAVIHGITDDQLAHAVEPEIFLEALMPDLAGRVLLAHNTDIEMGFLKSYCERIYAFPFELHAVDTLRLEHTKIGKNQGQAQGGMLRLGACRERYNLPRYKAHNALTDAIACGELFLAQMAHSGPTVKLVLREAMV